MDSKTYHKIHDIIWIKLLVIISSKIFYVYCVWMIGLPETLESIQELMDLPRELEECIPRPEPPNYNIYTFIGALTLFYLLSSLLRIYVCYQNF